MSKDTRPNRSRTHDSEGDVEHGQDERGAGFKKRMISLDDSLVASAAKAISLHRGCLTPTTRQTISLAVQTYLPVVLERLRHAGLVHWPDSTKRPRSLDDAAWAALADATEKVPLGQIELLRCCLTLAMREGGDAESTGVQDRE